MSVSHPLQSEAWGQFRSVMGIDVVRIRPLGPELAEGQLTFHNIPFTPFTVGYFPKGPLPTQPMLEELTKIGKQKRAVFIQLEPNVAHHSSFVIHHSSFLKPSHHSLFTKYTFVLDLTKTEEELLQSMHPKTRYNLKIAQKHAVVVKEDNSPEAFEKYLKLSRETTTRQGFYAHNETYHRRMWKILHPAKIAHLWTASYKEKILAAWIIFIWDKTLYYPYGSSSRENRDVMAPTLLLWEIAKWGKNQGFTSFDLWGALGPHPDEHDPWYGFHRFKQGFNPQLVEFVGSFDLVLHPWLYWLYTIADTIRWRMLKK
ncbi:MAG: peptidoglycan bridge formation glycyltransferase FemA/FemB family protein [Candidatus Gottesmanbacteria bacterium]|nr:peptidoglycan bridge formation glycyltransferase FemA/FemB family protein [Candidatus Gottesmanbacteria bacterium]